MKLARLASGVSIAMVAACSSATTTAPDVPAPTPVLTPEESTKPASCADNWVSVAVGKVRNDAGEAIESAVVGYCVKSETNLCLPTTKSEKGGWYTYRVGADHRCLKEIVARADPKDEDIGKYSVAYCNIPPAAKNGLLQTPTDLVLYRIDAPLAPPSTTRQAVKFASGIELTFSSEDLLEKNLAPKIGAKILDVASPPCFVKPSDNLAMLVAFGPDVNVNLFFDKPKIGFRIPNTAKLPDGAKVDLLLQGGFATYLDKEHHLDEGSFGPYGTGTVRGDFIVPDPGSELPALTMLGIRLKK